MLSETLAGEGDSVSSSAYNPFTDDNPEAHRDTGACPEPSFVIPNLGFPLGAANLLP